MDEVGILRALVEEYSPSGREAGAARTFVKLARELGFAAETDGVGNALARIGTGPPVIAFLGHIDTVEGELPVRLEGGRLFGRGTCDAKGAVAAALIAASRHDGPGEILVIAAVGEERDSRGTRHLLTYLPRPDFLVVGEPSGWDAVTIGYKGNLSIAVAVEGERVHLSAPEGSTVEKGLAILDAVRAFCATRRGETLYGSLTMKVHSIETSRKGGRERVEMSVNFRLPPGLAVGEILGLPELTAPDVGCTVVDQSEAAQVDARNEVVRSLCEGIRAGGHRPTLRRKLGTSDLNLAVPGWGCPAAAYGPGDSHLDHTDTENLSVVDFLAAIEVLRAAFRRLSAAGGRVQRSTAMSVAAPRASP